MNRADKSAVWVGTSARPPFSSPLAFFNQHEKILVLRAANKELKVSIGQELAAATQRRAKELEAEIERMRTELESLRSQ
ncbi:hypothetical protein BHE74_00037152 [Ensete ventricosum]|nr:hypothetical protein BHE74_00037152 [Ensete ventricosum]